MDFMDFSRRLYRWASEGVDMYAKCHKIICMPGMDRFLSLALMYR